MMYDYLIRIGLSLFLSAIIGWEREAQEKNAGLRTVILVSLGSTVFTLIPFILLSMSKELNFTFDFSRIIAYVIAGIGFLSGMVIITNKSKKKVEGITTSACIWAVVSMSILCGLGEYLLAIIVGICIWVILKLRYVKIKIIKNGKK